MTLQGQNPRMVVSWFGCKKLVQPGHQSVALTLLARLHLPLRPTPIVDFPAGLISSTIFAPLYLYASLRGKFDFWKALLERVPLQDGNPATDLSLPTLDAGCGRGLVLVQTAEIRAPVARNRGSHKHLAQSVGIDLFITADQTGNSANVTCKNLLAEGVGYVTELYKASFLELPFEDDTFGIFTCSLACRLHSRTDTSSCAIVRLIR